ncbi:MAG: ABC transporter permease [Phycisphaeraceae bacterium]|nr:MAG: ABC transporter permease [Phycisphaeraceae bacterium]
MRKIFAAAVREYRTTALTPAFLIGAVILPVAIWGIIAAVAGLGLLTGEKAVMEGRIAILDESEDQLFFKALTAHFDPEAQRARDEKRREQIQELMDQSPMSSMMSEEEKQRAMRMAAPLLGLERIGEIVFEPLESEEQFNAARDRLGAGELRALIRVGESTLILPELTEAEQQEVIIDDDPLLQQAAASRQGPMQSKPTFRFAHAEDLDSDHVRALRSAVAQIAQNERFRRAGMDVAMVRAIDRSQPEPQTTVVTSRGEERESRAEFQRMMPFIFMMLLFTAAVTGGQYLLMGTLEEKGSRVMEVLLSAISPMQLLIAKLVGQGLVGLTILVMYTGLGLLLADRFNLLQLIPMAQVGWMVIYFLIAYAFLGAMMVAVGAAVTEIREAQALYAPITFSMILPFVLMFPIIENPASIWARIFSYFPPTTPFVMVMRLSQPAYPVPLWEILATIVVGFAGVVLVTIAAAKIFRVGVLMYGKPPSMLTLLKWLREA